MAKKKRSDVPILQLKLRGPGVRRGRVSIPDLVRLCREAQNAVNKQAEALKGRKTIHPGPTAATIQEECTLELVGIRANCTTLDFDLARPQTSFPWKEEFGAEVVQHVANTIRSVRKNRADDIDPGVLLSVYELSGLVESRRISHIEWVAPRFNGHERVSAPITKTVRDRIAERLSRPRNVIVQVDGVLNMADFKPKERKCRIDPSIGTSITCSFDESRERDVLRLLQQPVRVKGRGTLQPYTDRIDTVSIDEISPLPSLSLGEGNFFANRTIEELADVQNVKPLRDVSVLAGGISTDVDVDEFLREIYDARK